MVVRTCLLVSDDPDDHIEFSEALYEISDDIVLVSVAHPEKALGLLALRQCFPSFIFLNLEMNGFQPDDFIKSIEENQDLDGIDLIAYGEYGDYDKLKTRRVSAFINSDMSYTELRNFLQKIVKR